MSIKDRRKALGWSRRDLAARAALDHRVVQLVELGQWEEYEALGRIEAVLRRAEAGEDDVQLQAPRPSAAETIGAAPPEDEPLN